MTTIHHIKESTSDWNDFVSEHPKGSIFHTREMHQVFANTPGHSPFSICARGRDGQIIAMLNAIKIDTLKGLLTRFTSRSVMMAEPICSDSEEGREGLQKLIAMHDQQLGRKLLFTEVRPSYAGGCEHDALIDSEYEYLSYLNYVNDLTEGADALAKRIKKTMRKVKTSHKRGVTVERIESPDRSVVERAYDKIQASYKRSKVPVAPVELFHAANEYLPGSVLQIRLAKLDGEDVGAAIGLVYKSRYFAWYNGSTRPKGLSIAHTLVWDEIQTACSLGLCSYDFGGAGWPDDDYGPRTFKSRFGGELIDQGRYRKVSSAVRMAVAEKGYGFLRGILTSRYSSGERTPVANASEG